MSLILMIQFPKVFNSEFFFHIHRSPYQSYRVQPTQLFYP